MNKYDRLIEAFPDHTFMRAKGFDDALIGVCETSMRLIYSISQCVDVLMEEMSFEEAYEHFTLKIIVKYEGDESPIWSYSNF